MLNPTRTVFPSLFLYLVGNSRIMPRLISWPRAMTVISSVTSMEESGRMTTLLLKSRIRSWAAPAAGQKKAAARTSDITKRMLLRIMGPLPDMRLESPGPRA